MLNGYATFLIEYKFKIFLICDKKPILVLTFFFYEHC